MKKLISSFFCAFLFVYATPAWAKVEYDFSQLMMKNAEQVTDLVKKRIQQGLKIQEKQEDSSDGTFEPEVGTLEFLKDAMRIALSRPDQEGLRGILFARIRRELNDMNSAELVLKQLADESIEALKDKKGSVPDHSTYIVVLENMMAEIKPEIKTNSTFREIIEKVRDAKIEVSKDVQNQQKLKLMRPPISPSETAKSILSDKKK